MKPRTASISCLAILLIICSITQAQEPVQYVVQPTTKQYTKFPNRLIRSGQPVKVLVVRGRAYLDGDIFVGNTVDLDQFQHMFQAFGVTQDAGRWPNGIVPFEILDGFTTAERQMILDAMNHHAAVTHVCFVPSTNGGRRIKFKKYTVQDLGFAGGSSELGCNGSNDGQEIKLSALSNRTVRHEIGHALGLLHEQSRQDRDNFVEILGNNIEFPFNLGTNFSTAIWTSTDVGSYDFSSIMHYTCNAFGKLVNGTRLQTIRRRSNPSDCSFGHASALSAGDIHAINSMYPTERSCAALTPLFPGELEVGHSKTISIQAREPYNLTGIFVRNGQTFQFSTASPAWNNGSRVTDCNGYPGSVLDRHGDINEMAMTGEIYEQNNKDHYTGKYFKIGCGRTFTVTRSGYLICFANDTLLNGYGDNSRIVTLTVKRTQ